MDKPATIDNPTIENFLPKITKSTLVNNVSPFNKDMDGTDESSLHKKQRKKSNKYKKLLKTLKSGKKGNLESNLKGEGINL